jgi:hypothetical protein
VGTGKRVDADYDLDYLSADERIIDGLMASDDLVGEALDIMGDAFLIELWPQLDIELLRRKIDDWRIEREHQGDKTDPGSVGQELIGHETTDVGTNEPDIREQLVTQLEDRVAKRQGTGDTSSCGSDDE